MVALPKLEGGVEGLEASYTTKHSRSLQIRLSRVSAEQTFAVSCAHAFAGPLSPQSAGLTSAVAEAGHPRARCLHQADYSHPRLDRIGRPPKRRRDGHKVGLLDPHEQTTRSSPGWHRAATPGQVPHPQAGILTSSEGPRAQSSIRCWDHFVRMSCATLSIVGMSADREIFSRRRISIKSPRW